MNKLEVIDGKQTNWNGLWWHKEYNGFSSGVIDLSELRKFKGRVRLYVRKNAFFNKGENGRPNYNFCLKDANSDTFSELRVSADEYKCLNDLEYDDILNILLEDKDIEYIIQTIEKIKGERLYTYDEIYTAVQGATRDGANGYTDNLVSDYV